MKPRRLDQRISKSRWSVCGGTGQLGARNSLMHINVMASLCIQHFIQKVLLSSEITFADTFFFLTDRLYPVPILTGMVFFHNDSAPSPGHKRMIL